MSDLGVGEGIFQVKICHKNFSNLVLELLFCFTKSNQDANMNSVMLLA